MCLREILDDNPPPGGVGYKVFRKVNDFGYTLPIFSSNYSFIPVQATIVNIHKKLIGFGSSCYKAGFHLFPCVNDAKRFAELIFSLGVVVIKVEYSDARVFGKMISGMLPNGNHIFEANCIVADKIKLIEKVV